MTHFTDLELRRWSESGPGAARERVVAHVAECAACAASYAAAIRARPLDGEAPAGIGDFAAAGYRVARPQHRVWSWAVPLAAAAVLVIALVAPHFRRQRETMTFRGGAIHTLAPQGAADLHSLVFTWSSAISAGRFRLQVGNAGGVIYSVETPQSRLEAPQPLRQVLEPGGEFWWTVSALDGAGKPLPSSIDPRDG